MAKVEVIGEESFAPIQMTLKERIGTTALFAAVVLMGRYFVPPFSHEYESLVKESRLLLFYGQEALDAFIKSRPPQPQERPYQLPFSRLLHLH